MMSHLVTQIQCLTLAVLSAVALTQNCGCPDLPFFPHGPAAGDSLITGDDAAGLVNLPIPVTFGDQQYTTLYVTDNGLITFGDSYNPYVNECPLPDTSTSVPLIAVYWDDFDPSCGNSDEILGYRYTEDPDILSQVNSYIRCTYNNEYAGTGAVVITFKNVRQYDCSDYPNTRNTFQGIFVTDSSNTYLITKFVELDVQSVHHDLGSTIGEQQAPGQYSNHPLTCLISDDLFSSDYYTNNVCNGIIVRKLVIDACSNYPCPGDTICVVDEIDSNSYTCQCNPGFDGDNCEIDIDECADDPCQNGATCVDGINQYTCECATGFMGSDCEINCQGCYVCDNSESMEECTANQMFVPCIDVIEDCGDGSRVNLRHSSNSQSSSNSLEDNADAPMCVTSYRKRGRNYEVEKHCSNGCAPDSNYVIGPGECMSNGDRWVTCAEVSQPMCESEID